MLQATIPYGSADNDIIAVACLRRPKLAVNERAVRAMLASVRLAK